MGALGLPGDLFRVRLLRVAFTRMNAVSGDSETESVSQFFHILGSVDQQRGCCEVAEGKYEITIYTSCCNATRGIYYYTTYDNHRIMGVDMHAEDLDGTTLTCYPMIEEGQVSGRTDRIKTAVRKCDGDGAGTDMGSDRRTEGADREPVRVSAPERFAVFDIFL